MNYKAAGAPKAGKNAPRHAEHNARGTDKNPFSKSATKAELVERMKAAAGKRTGADAGTDSGKPTGKPDGK
jgi:hypothetical protein